MVCLLTFEAPFGIDAQGNTAVPSDDDEAKNFEIGGDDDSGEDGVKVTHALDSRPLSEPIESGGIHESAEF